MFFPLLFLLIQWQLFGLGVILRLYFTLFCYLLHWVRLTWIDINIIYALLTHVISRARSGILVWYSICLDDVPRLVWIRCWPCCINQWITSPGSVAVFGVEMLFLACYRDRCISVLRLLQQYQLMCVWLVWWDSREQYTYKDLYHPRKKSNYMLV